MSVCFVPHCEALRLRHCFHSHKEIPNPQSRSGRAIVGLIDWRPWGGSGVKSRHVLALQRWLTRTGLWLCNQRLMPAQRASVSHRVGTAPSPSPTSSLGYAELAGWQAGMYAQSGRDMAPLPAHIMLKRPLSEPPSPLEWLHVQTPSLACSGSCRHTIPATSPRCRIVINC